MGQLYTETIPVCNLVELDGVEYKKFPDVTPENGYIYLAKFEGDEELDPVILAYARDHWWTGKETRPVVLWAKLPR